jgi:hypothetical protein
LVWLLPLPLFIGFGLVLNLLQELDKPELHLKDQENGLVGRDLAALVLPVLPWRIIHGLCQYQCG